MFIASHKLFHVNLFRNVQLKNLENTGHGKFYFNLAIINKLPFVRNFSYAGTHGTASKLTPLEVNKLLQANELTKEFSSGTPIKSYDSNQLPSNDPMEDTVAQAQCLSNNGFLFGVFDGHSGGTCAQVVAKRLFSYIAAYFLSHQELQTLSDSLTGTPMKILEFFNRESEFTDVIKNLHTSSYQSFIKELLRSGEKKKAVDKILESSFLQLDADISREAIETENGTALHHMTLSVALSGVVTCVAYINGPHLYVASVGDCQAVLGTLADNGQWIPKLMSVQHNAENTKEVERILSEHPKSEQETIIKVGRLFGQLAPLRAFGDYRYKWDKETLKKVIGQNYRFYTVPDDYHTPPYLTAKPDVSYHHLTIKDKFLVLATDGLWDFISPPQVVRMVGEHMRGKTVLTPFRLPKENITLGEINEALLVRKECLTMKPTDTNVCTHLLRNSLGGTEYGLDPGRLSELLSLPKRVVRSFRDDISITVIYFDNEYLREYMPEV